MNVKCLASLVLATAVSGCSFYDVSTNFEDALLGNGLFAENWFERDPDHPEWNGRWDQDVSHCIKNEKALRPLLRQLDESVEGKDFVILPTGEKYPIERPSPVDESSPGATERCRLRHSN